MNVQSYVIYNMSLSYGYDGVAVCYGVAPTLDLYTIAFSRFY